MYNTILVPLDGSPRAERILPHVEELAKKYEAKLIFLQVVEPVPLNGGKEGHVLDAQAVEAEEKNKAAEIYLNGIQGEFREKNYRTAVRLEGGPVVETIIRVAERENVDLIAMASHGRSGIARVFYGSVAAGVLQRVDRPLLLVRSRRD